MDFSALLDKISLFWDYGGGFGMKKEIFTAVIMVILAVLFCSCEKWDIEIVDPRDVISSIESVLTGETSSENSSESESIPEESDPESKPSESAGKAYSAKSVHRDEAEEFMLTEEAFDDIKIFVSHLGNVNFEKRNDIVGSNVIFWFGERLYLASGEPETETGDFFAEKALCEMIIKKYFGINYILPVTEENYDAEKDAYLIKNEAKTGANKFLSCEAEMLGGNRVKCTVLMVGAKDSIGENFVISEMFFDVMEDSDGKFLRIVSNNVVEKFRESSFEDQAKSLTELIVEQMGKKGFESSVQERSQQTAVDFIIRLQAKVNMHRDFDKKTPYIGEFFRDDEGYHFPVAAMKKVAAEVYGIGNFDFISDRNFIYNKEEKEYTSGLEWGMEINAKAENMETYVTGNRYIVSFSLVTLESVDGDPEWVTGEKYKITFELIDGSYLRYISYDRA